MFMLLFGGGGSIQRVFLLEKYRIVEMDISASL